MLKRYLPSGVALFFLMSVIAASASGGTLDSPSPPDSTHSYTIEDIYDSPVAAMIPLSEDVAGMQSADIFSLRYPDHRVSKEIKKIAAVIRHLE